jgi:hypothetical protein
MFLKNGKSYGYWLRVEISFQITIELDTCKRLFFVQRGITFFFKINMKNISILISFLVLTPLSSYSQSIDKILSALLRNWHPKSSRNTSYSTMSDNSAKFYIGGKASLYYQTPQFTDKGALLSPLTTAKAYPTNYGFMVGYKPFLKLAIETGYHWMTYTVDFSFTNSPISTRDIVKNIATRVPLLLKYQLINLGDRAFIHIHTGGVYDMVDNADLGGGIISDPIGYSKVTYQSRATGENSLLFQYGASAELRISRSVALELEYYNVGSCFRIRILQCR